MKKINKRKKNVAKLNAALKSVKRSKRNLIHKQVFVRALVSNKGQTRRAHYYSMLTSLVIKALQTAPEKLMSTDDICNNIKKNHTIRIDNFAPTISKNLYNNKSFFIRLSVNPDCWTLDPDYKFTWENENKKKVNTATSSTADRYKINLFGKLIKLNLKFFKF